MVGVWFIKCMYEWSEWMSEYNNCLYKCMNEQLSSIIVCLYEWTNETINELMNDSPRLWLAILLSPSSSSSSLSMHVMNYRGDSDRTQADTGGRVAKRACETGV